MQKIEINKLENLYGGSCGQNTMDCIENAYTKQGWISVWAFVQTAFIPATAAAIAYGCAVINCNPS